MKSISPAGEWAEAGERECDSGREILSGEKTAWHAAATCSPATLSRILANELQTSQRAQCHKARLQGRPASLSPKSPNRLDLARSQPVPARAQHLVRLVQIIEREQCRDLLEARERFAERAGRVRRLRDEVRQDAADVAVEAERAELHGTVASESSSAR